MEKWAGFATSGTSVRALAIEFDEEGGNRVIVDAPWPLGTEKHNECPQAYLNMYKRVRDFIKENNIPNVVVKGSAVSRSSATLALLHAAELRGVVITAAKEANATVHMPTKASVSQRRGKRKVDDYVKDDEFWKDEDLAFFTNQESKELALLILSVRDK